MKAHRIFAVALALIVASMPVFALAQNFDTASIKAPQGYRVELITTGLDSPTMVNFDDQGRLLIAESGKSGNNPEVVRIEPDGSVTALASAKDFGAELPVSSVAFHDNKIYIGHGGTISTVDQQTLAYKDLLSGFQGRGNFQIGQIVFQGSIMYFSIGTVTNSGVVGPDDTWLKDSELKSLHDVPCQNITLTAQAFESTDALNPTDTKKVQTSPFTAFGQTQPKNAAVAANSRCNGAIYRVNSDGSNLQLFASGLRNAFGMQIGPDNNLYASLQGISNIGSRPVGKAADCFYKIQQDQWYGWPDFNCGVAVTNKSLSPQQNFILAKHPTDKLPVPAALFDPGAGVGGFAFAPSNDWGQSTDAFVALNSEHKVIRLDISKGESTDFISGFQQPSDVKFSPDGSMYVTDAAGAVWRISKINPVHDNSDFHTAFGFSVVSSIVQTLILIVLTYLFVFRKGDMRYSPRRGIIYGFMSAITMVIIALISAVIIYRVQWYAPLQLFDVFKPVSGVLNFNALSLLVGLVIMLVLMTFWGLVFSLILRTEKVWRIIIGSLIYSMAVWSVMQFLVLPGAALVVGKTFPPTGFMVIFLIYGLMLGYYFSEKQIKAML